MAELPDRGLAERKPGGAMPAVPAHADLPALEHEMLARWNRNRTFEDSLKQTEGGPRWTFYEGPPTANGMPGVHHIEARVFKDLFPRFKTMQGFHVKRKAGWDCHGLPVEVAVEKELGLSGKKDIEAYGVAEFNERCRESVLRHVDAFSALTQRMGYWIDLSDAYRTMDADYVESVWWALKSIYDKGLLVRDFRISPYCPRCGTALSDHEMGQPDVYREVTDPSVTVRFPVESVPAGANSQLDGADLLVWTTTPWTLVSNTAVAVHPEVNYVVARKAGHEDKVVVAEALFARVLGDGWQVLATVRGTDLIGVKYTRPFGIVDIPDAHRVVAGSFVTTEDGTGLVHLAPAFGADDMEVSRANGLPRGEPGAARRAVRGRAAAGRRDVLQGRGQAAGRGPGRARAAVQVRAARAQLPALLAVRHRAAVLRAAVLVHQDHRDQGPAARGEREDQLAAAHDQERPVRRVAAQQRRLGAVADPVLGHAAAAVGVPVRARDVRSGRWPSWARWRSRTCPGSTRTGRTWTTSTFPCPEDGLEAHRVPEVIDAWFDSGSMPFAQWGAPLRNLREFEEAYPAQFICEAIDQTRGWFYSLMAVGTLVFGHSSYENVVCLGHVVDEQGRKMSKHLGNVIEPMGLMNAHGADAVRWFFAASGSPWGQRRIGPVGARRDRAQGAAHVLEHGLVPGAVRERVVRGVRLRARRGRRSLPRSAPAAGATGRCWTGGCCRSCTRACGT